MKVFKYGGGFRASYGGISENFREGVLHCFYESAIKEMKNWRQESWVLGIFPLKKW